MTFILNLETSTSVCSVSVTGNGKELFVRAQSDAKSHASQLIPFIIEALKESGLRPQDLSAIAVSKGPGSYTGLRIGVSTAKGLAYALNVPLIAVNTLLSMAAGFLDQYTGSFKDNDQLFCPMIDARRMEVYTAVYTRQLKELSQIKAEIIQQDSFQAILKDNCIHFFGDGAMKCKEMINNKAAIFYTGFYPSATFVGNLAFKYFNEGLFENLAYFEPFYLKDFVGTIPSNKMF